MQKLENLEIDKVAFVPEGDNRGADVLFYKRKPDGSEKDKSPDGDVNSNSPEGNLWKRFLAMIAKGLGLDQTEEADNTQGEGTNGDDPGDITPPTGDEPGQNPDPNTDSGAPAAKSQKGVEEMNIDKSKLTPEELAQLEAIEKKAAVQEEPAQEPAPTPEEGDTYKGVSPAVVKELKELRKRADEAEKREMLATAKKYEILGKKPEELAETLKSLKDAGGTAYSDMIAVLDTALDTVEKTGAFKEIGHNGHGKHTDDAWSAIEKHAAEIRKSKPEISLTEAIDMACAQHPDLVADYENSRK